MTRLVKILGILGFSSVYLMQGACTYGGHGYSILPTTILTTANLQNLFGGLIGT